MQLHEAPRGMYHTSPSKELNTSLVLRPCLVNGVQKEICETDPTLDNQKIKVSEIGLC